MLWKYLAQLRVQAESVTLAHVANWSDSEESMVHGSGLVISNALQAVGRQPGHCGNKLAQVVGFSENDEYELLGNAYRGRPRASLCGKSRNCTSIIASAGQGYTAETCANILRIGLRLRRVRRRIKVAPWRARGQGS
jgi:hypothetical protein